MPGGSTLAVVREGRSTPLTVGDEAVIGLRYTPSETVDAGLVFAGYGLSTPEAGHDDLSELDVRGRILVYVAGAPDGVPADLLAHAQSSAADRAPLAKAGAVGLIALGGAATRDVPWDRVVHLAAIRRCGWRTSRWTTRAGSRLV